MSALSRLLLTAAGDRGGRQLAREAQERGVDLGLATIHNYLAGRHGKPTEATLDAFHRLLGVPLAELRTAAGLPQGAEEPWAPPAEAARLTPRQRRALDELIRAIAQPAEASDGSRAPGPPAPAAAPPAVAGPAAPPHPWPRPVLAASGPGDLAALVDELDEAREPGPPVTEEQLRGMAARRGRVVESEDEW